ncbi:N-acyl-phosphatidylethanolamine-hydrolyzing phospholipase d [Plakobranchus ocellatus]|uniref:N-acetylphosphatidylethanolamine-hydrolyzing phospholipase D n=1 Tax=Plakobranchus ocellatus TaxID=259542 RepID=A0AAV4C0F8_9GAST|nr:N-acyl-phosphatidylethanolamine-hydrolyzing phospholipase d [Plakobranchus ocellatus]
MAEGAASCEDNEDGRVQPVFKDGKYSNPWGVGHQKGFSERMKFFMGKSNANVPRSERELDQTLPILKPDFSAFAESPETGVRHLWVGHATSLVQFDGIILLTDPIFSDRKSPSQLIGPKRYRKPPCTISELPNIDCVLISHNHYDHLDYNSVLALYRRFGDSLCWYVPMGIKKWMSDCGVNNVVECTWWQEHNADSGFKFVCTPAQHWSTRTLNDENKTLWCSWCVKGPRHSFYFAGDTGYCPAFKEIGRHYGPFTLATIPIGAYEPRSFLGAVHTDPEDGIKVHKDIQSKASIGIHWGTFHNIAKEFYLEPREKLKKLLEEQGMPATAFITTKHGETVLIGENNA